MTTLLLGGVVAAILAAFALLLRTERTAGAQEAAASIENKALQGRVEALTHARTIDHEIDRGSFADAVDGL